MHYESGLEAASVAPDPDLTRIGPATDDFGYEAVRAVMALSRPPTAIYLSSPQQTAGGVKAIGELKLQVPEQLSVVVTGSAIWYEIWPGGLTSISLPLRQMADTASRLLLAPGPDAQESTFVKLGYELHLRGSTAPP
jgi:LacI family transcriptional regulator